MQIVGSLKASPAQTTNMTLLGHGHDPSRFRAPHLQIHYPVILASLSVNVHYFHV